MENECSCGENCPLCDQCDSPLCECYCDVDPEDLDDDTPDPYDADEW